MVIELVTILILMLLAFTMIGVLGYINYNSCRPIGGYHVWYNGSCTKCLRKRK